MVDRKSGWRDVIIDMLGRKCVACEEKESLEIHHIKPTRLGGNNTIDNLCVLCRSCHIKIHYKKPNDDAMKSYINFEIGKWYRGFWSPRQKYRTVDVWRRNRNDENVIYCR